jgi:hypothetical protein
MCKLNGIFSPLLSFVLMFAVGVCLASTGPGSKTSTTKTNTQTASKADSATKPTIKAPAKKMSHVLASAEDLSGTITVVDASERELTLIGPNGVPYDFDLTRKTRVELSNNQIGVKELANESHQQATIHFVPTSHGNLAESINISAS